MRAVTIGTLQDWAHSKKVSAFIVQSNATEKTGPQKTNTTKEEKGAHIPRKRDTRAQQPPQRTTFAIGEIASGTEWR